MSKHLVAVLTRAAKVVLFSAAPPGQGGVGHVNEQWPEYWRDLFQAHGFRMLDLIRSRIRDDQRVVWWYRQNLLLFSGDAGMKSYPTLHSADNLQQVAIEWVHVNMLRRAGVKNLIRHLRPALTSAIKRRIGLQKPERD